MRKIIKSLVAVSALTLSSAAYASIIDFTDMDTWLGVDGETSFTANDNGIDVTLDTFSDSVDDYLGTMTFNRTGDTPPGTLNLTNGGSLDGEGDGIGIRLIGDSDEINYDGSTQEFLNVTFDELYSITEVFILDLFNNEISVFSIDGTTDSYQAGSSVNWGFHEIDVSGTGNTMELSFWVDPPAPGDDGDNDYALAGLRVESVPEPSIIALFTAGLFGIGFARRRQS